MLNGLLSFIGRLPLTFNHRLGACLGWLTSLFSARHRELTRANLQQYAMATGTDASEAMLASSFREQGRSLTELAISWAAPLARQHALIVENTGWESVDQARSKGRALIFAVPHLGCYEIAGRYIASQVVLTAMYRPPKLRWLESAMRQGRDRGTVTTVPADAGGVRSLLKTLKRGGAVMILPDQVPGEGEGEWADFFGRPAYTMTLLPRLALAADAAVFFVFAERLPAGAGFRVVTEVLPEPFSADRAIACRQMNAMIERLVRQAPTQYLWGYNRYKQPAGAPPPPHESTP
ncbi:MAG: lysophospholipid acyltransferase family protein [Betaproteobacteria bacterium]|nr:lysophospholipid acyltransferase family protein [Betaproteobacteria bacterium]